ncbi:MAG: hypothetical protein A2X45_15410 [Lentisphaerae bacterium GWF2_50_93]|nr:MAG: hypothetical protein A2X45_15410 [Lentisphaerae bacterium GWF2_50_93]
MIKIAVIGAGRHSCLHHGPACRALKERMDLAAVCDRNIDAAKAFSMNFGFRSVYADYMEMIKKEKPDAVIAVTPEAVTRKIVGDIIPSGIPILMEKPIGNNLKEAEELCGIAEKSSSRIMVSFNRRFSPMIRPALEWLGKNTGNSAPQMFRASIQRHDRHDLNFLSATAIHPLDILVSVMGMPARTNIVQSSSKPGTEPVTKVDMQFANGSLAELMIAPDCGILSEAYEVIGGKYCARIDYFNSMEIWHDGKIVSQIRIDPLAPVEINEGAVAEMEYFLECVEGKAPFSPGVIDGLNMAILGEKIQNTNSR